MSTTRALIDAEFHDTQIGSCVVLGQAAHEWQPTSGMYSVCGKCRAVSGDIRDARCPALFAGDVLAVVDSSSISDAVPQWLRRGFVRVVEVLPVVGKDIMGRTPDRYVYTVAGGATYHCHNGVENDLPFTASPGDVVLVTEPDCDCDDGKVWTYRSTGPFYAIDCADCAPSTVRVIHRDGVLGEIET